MPVEPDQPHLRQSMLFITDIVVTSNLNRIEAVFAQLKPRINQGAVPELDLSLSLLKAVQPALRLNGYDRQEDPQAFKELSEKVRDVFKNLLGSYLTDRATSVPDKNIVDNLYRTFINSIAGRLGIAPKDVRQTYPSLTWMVRTLRNTTEHGQIPKAPKDVVTGRQDYGNIYTLCSTYLLAVYAYLEVLEVWANAEGV